MLRIHLEHTFANFDLGRLPTRLLLACLSLKGVGVFDCIVGNVFLDISAKANFMSEFLVKGLSF